MCECVTKQQKVDVVGRQEKPGNCGEACQSISRKEMADIRKFSILPQISYFEMSKYVLNVSFSIPKYNKERM